MRIRWKIDRVIMAAHCNLFVEFKSLQYFLNVNTRHQLCSSMSAIEYWILKSTKWLDNLHISYEGCDFVRFKFKAVFGRIIDIMELWSFCIMDPRGPGLRNISVSILVLLPVILQVIRHDWSWKQGQSHQCIEWWQMVAVWYLEYSPRSRMSPRMCTRPMADSPRFLMGHSPRFYYKGPDSKI